VDLLIDIMLISGAYLIGSIPTGLLLCKYRYKTDIRNEGSGNIGATNVGRVISENFGKEEGKKAKMYVLLGDISKGLLPVSLALYLGVPETITAIVAGEALVGHCFPVYLRFKESGKGVATGLGVSIAILTWWSLIPIATYLVLKKTTKYVSVASMTATGTSAFVAILSSQQTVYVVFFFLSFGLIIFTHRSNIKRLYNHTEPKIGDNK